MVAWSIVEILLDANVSGRGGDLLVTKA